eukprot:TRINITY_DN22526_c0_g1_i2.p1 TRINITY_DN22526_c0_g1~~TRINITY_DN22526_c0_g1_i2.p1  ORF type:complete len:140 (-),score=18.99 TRINITY_DN22526_c0_g1_i2:113-532(-)
MLVFGVFLNCGGPRECTYQSNFLYAAIMTVVGTALVFEARNAARAMDENQTLNALRVTAVTLVVGWSWGTFFSTWVKYLVEESTSPLKDGDAWLTANYYFVLFLCHWGLLSMVFHDVQRRRHDKAQVREYWKKAVAELP